MIFIIILTASVIQFKNKNIWEHKIKFLIKYVRFYLLRVSFSNYILYKKMKKIYFFFYIKYLFKISTIYFLQCYFHENLILVFFFINYNVILIISQFFSFEIWDFFWFFVIFWKLIKILFFSSFFFFYYFSFVYISSWKKFYRCWE